jgi:hypothetical protein
MSTTLLSPNLRRYANISFAGIVYYIFVIIILHILRPDVNPLSQLTSDYAYGPFSILMITAYFGMSLGSLALVIGLNRAVSRPARSLFGLIFMGVWAVGLLIAGIIPLFPNLAQQTIAETIYRINAPLHVASLAIGAFLVSWRFKQDDYWRSSSGILLILSIIMLVLFIGVGITTATGSVIGGIGQRLFIASALTWLSLTSARLRSISTELDTPDDMSKG